MSIQNALQYGALGLATDLFTGGLTRGLGARIGFLYGLFQPDASQMDRVYAPAQAARGAPAQSSVGFPMAGTLFGARGTETSAPRGPSWGGIAAVAATILPVLAQAACFGAPLYVPSLWSTPWSPAGLIPSLWSRGVISNWGWSAGFLI